MDKITRMLSLYSKLINGEGVNKTIFCFENDCSPRTFDRDIEDVRIYLSESFSCQNLKYDRRNDTYFIEGVDRQELEPMEFLFVERILRDTSVLREDELEVLIAHLLSNTINHQTLLKTQALSDEKYESPTHNRALLKIHSDLNTIIRQKKCIEITYYRQDGEEVKKKILPCAIKYDLGYLYLIGFRYGENDKYPAYYRLDRIYSFTIERNLIQEEQDKISLYMKNFANGIVQMYGDEYVKIKLKCNKNYLAYIHDKFRQMEIIEEGDEDIVVAIATFETGFVKWLISQPQEMYTIVEPESTKLKLVEEAKKIMQKYGGAC